MPRTTAPLTASARMPATLRSSRSRSLGHFRPGGVGSSATRSTASAGATPASSGSQPRLPGGTGGQSRSGRAVPGRSRTLVAMPARAGESHSRPRRPRPAVCRSATTTRPSGSPARAASATSALVEPVSTRRSIRVQRPSGRSGRAGVPGRSAAGGRDPCTASRAPGQPTARRAAAGPAGGPAPGTAQVSVSWPVPAPGDPELAESCAARGRDAGESRRGWAAARTAAADRAVRGRGDARAPHPACGAGRPCAADPRPGGAPAPNAAARAPAGARPAATASG